MIPTNRVMCFQPSFCRAGEGKAAATCEDHYVLPQSSLESSQIRRALHRGPGRREGVAEGSSVQRLPRNEPKVIRGKTVRALCFLHSLYMKEARTFHILKIKHYVRIEHYYDLFLLLHGTFFSFFQHVDIYIYIIKKLINRSLRGILLFTVKGLIERRFIEKSEGIHLGFPHVRLRTFKSTRKPRKRKCNEHCGGRRELFG